MVYPRDVLNRLKWAEGSHLDKATIWYVHRGAPGDFRRIEGAEIIHLEKFFFETKDSKIPYHRVLRIDYEGKTVFERDRSAKGLR